MKLTTKDIVLCGMFAAITAVASQIAIPVHPVPFTMQIFAVYFSGIILGSKRGFIAQVIYILLGAAGAPVFANFRGGFQVIAGPIGGYIIAFPIMAFIVGYFIKNKNRVGLFIGLILALVLCYILGTIQLSIVTKLPITKAIQVGVIPFVIVDLIKIVVAYIIGIKVKNRVQVATY